MAKTYAYYDGIIIRPGKRRMEIKEVASSGHLDRGAKVRTILIDAEKSQVYSLTPIKKKVGNIWMSTKNYKTTIEGLEFKLYIKDDTVTFYHIAKVQVA